MDMYTYIQGGFNLLWYCLLDQHYFTPPLMQKLVSRSFNHTKCNMADLSLSRMMEK